MTITVDPRLFHRAMALTSGPIDRRTTVPVLTAIRCRANARLQLESSDLDTTARAEIDYIGTAAEFVLPEPARLQKAIALAGGDTVELCPAHERTERGSETYKIDVESGTFATTLNTHHADGHPGAELVHFPEWHATITADDLRRLAMLRTAISTEETRDYLNGVALLKAEGRCARFAATDGHRLYLADLSLPDAQGEIPAGTIFPRRWFELAIKAFARTKEPLRLVWGRTAVKNTEGPDLPLEPGGYRIQLSGTLDGISFTLASRAIDGKYPDVGRVVPTETKHRFTVNRASLIRSIRTLAPLGSDKIRALRLGRAGQHALAIELQCPIIGNSRIEVPADGDLPDSIGFNGQYLRQAAEAFTGEDLLFAFNGAADPAVITDLADPTFRTVIMPMRV